MTQNKPEILLQVQSEPETKSRSSSPKSESSRVSSIGDEEIVNIFDKPHVSRKQITDLIGMRPKNIDIYRRALVHKSIQKNVRNCIDAGYTNILDYYRESNERLEYLGDSVLGLIVSSYLFEKYPGKDEGFLTRTKIKIVCGKNCAEFSKKLKLNRHLLMSNHVLKINGKESIKLLENTFEALIGAIFKDLGYKHAEMFVRNVIDKYLDFSTIFEDNNYKDIFLRYAQTEGLGSPIYNVINTDGPPHNRIFTIQVEFDGKKMSSASGKSKKEAEQLAAKKSIEFLDKGKINSLRGRDNVK